MSKKFTKRRPAAANNDTAASPEQKLYARLRERANRALRKRRRDKSHQ